MKKLTLKLDDLRIDSFDTTAAPRAKGTVFGEQCTCYTDCTCPGCPTCDASCDGSCDASCNGTCDASCNGTCGGCWETVGPAATCVGSCHGGDTCDYTCWGYRTAGPNGVCVRC